MVRSGSSSAARARASARISRPSASVLPTSMVRPLREFRTSPGPHGVAGDGVLDHRQQHGEAHRQLGGHHHPAQRQGVGRAAHVLLHRPHAGGRLDVEAAGVEHHALADQGHQRPARLAPADLDHPRRALRRGGAADGVHGRVAGLEQGVAGHHRDLRAERLGDFAGDGLHLQRPHVVGRGVDHVPGQGAGVGDGAQLGEVDAVGRDQPGAGLAALLAVAIEAVGPEREGQRDIAAAAGPPARGSAHRARPAAWPAARAAPSPPAPSPTPGQHQLGPASPVSTATSPALPREFGELGLAALARGGSAASAASASARPPGGSGWRVHRQAATTASDIGGLSAKGFDGPDYA